MNGDVLRGVGARNQTLWGNRIEQGANDRGTWHDCAIGGGGLRARTEPDEIDPSTRRDRATGDDCSRDPTNSEWFLRALDAAIWFFDIVLKALLHVERRARRDRMVRSPV